MAGFSVASAGEITGGEEKVKRRQLRGASKRT
jgi:hypothetical protein